MSAFDRFLDTARAHGRMVKPTGPGQAQVSCPGPQHVRGDRNPSLSVSDAGGKTLLHCHAGCSADEILAAFNLTMPDLYDDPAKRGEDYVYFDLQARPVHTVRRRYQGNEKKIWQDKGATNVPLYQLPELVEAVKQGRVVYLVEGEKDANTLRHEGHVATTARGGADNFKHADVSPLQGASVVAIVDRDKAGDTWAGQVQTKLAGVAASLAFYHGQGHDYSDHYAAGKTVTDLVPYPHSVSAASDVPEPTDNPLARIKSGQWLDTQTFPALQWAVPGIIPEGYGLLVGPPKLGKSWFVLGVLLAVAEGGYALGKIRVEQRPVLYAALEDGDKRMQYRARHVTAGKPIPAAFDYFTGPVEAIDVIRTINAWMDANPGGVVALDTLGKVLPPAKHGQGAYERDYAVGSELKAIADTHPGSTLLVVHHTRKMGSADFMDATSGTNGLNGAADFTILLKRERGEDEAHILLSGRDVEENDYLATMPDGVWQLEGDDLKASADMARSARVQAGLGDDQRNVLEYVTAHPEGVTAHDVADHMGWADTDDPTGKARKYLTRLFGAGRVSRPQRGTYAPLKTHVPSVPSVTLDLEQDTRDRPSESDGTLGTHVTPIPMGQVAQRSARCDTCKRADGPGMHGKKCLTLGCPGIYTVYWKKEATK